MSQAYEDEHVHQVYEQIADHFSSTRYKPWPLVEKFLKELPDGSVGLDVGCGNGKYLTVNPNIFVIGSDRSQALAKIARAHEPHVAIVADTLDLPHPLGRFDFAISIAVVHHLSTPSRRIAAVKEILGSLRAPRAYVSQASRAKALIYVWALEQKGSRRGWDEGDKQDVMVPWVSKVRQDHEIKTAPSFLGQDRKRDQMWNRETRQEPETSVTFQRYYHLYRANELEQDILAAGGIIFSAGYERDNWWAIAGQAHH